MSNKTIKDAGAVIPHAKKHSKKIRKKASTSKATSLTLRSLWPQPDWVALIDSGCEYKAVIYMAVHYFGFRNKPRDRFGVIDYHAWEKSFVENIKVLQHLFSKVKTLEDAKKIKSKLYDHFNLSSDDFVDNNLHVTYPAYALGSGGAKTIYSSFSLTGKQKEQIKWLETLNWPYNKDAIKANLFPIELENGSWVLAKTNRRSWTWSKSDEYPDKNSCIEEFTTRFIKDKSKPYHPVKPSIELDSNDMGLKDVTGEDIIKSFGFRGVQFGRSLSDVERQTWLNQAFHALNVFAELIRIPNKKWLGLGGLGIAFGARGSGSAMAHFEPELNVINLTRRLGASGNMAHEWFHALDHYLMKKLKVNTNYHFATQALMPLHPDYIKNTLRLPRHYQILRSFFKLGYGERNVHQFISQARNLSAQYRGRKYWATTVELYARCFEAYIQDKLIATDTICPWLVSGTLENDYPADRINKHPYPLGKERREFYGLWEEFMRAIFKL